ncbi:MAG: LVIVD repeat-containing protein [Acidobacteriota bacterium]
MRNRSGVAIFLLLAGLAGAATGARAAAPVLLSGITPTTGPDAAGTAAVLSGEGFTDGTQFTLVGGAAFFAGSTPAGSPTFAENDIIIRDGLAYVVQIDLRIFTLTDPSSPQQVGLLGVSGDALALSGNVLLVAQGNRLTSVDISDPTLPRLLASGVATGFCDVGGAAAQGDAVYVACGRATGVNVWNGTSFVQTVATAGPGSLFTGDVAAANGLALVTDAVSGLVALDLADPVDPVIIGQLDDGTLSGRAVTLAGEIAWVGGADAVAAVDISDPTAPALRGKAPIWVDAIGISEENGFVHAMDIRNGPHVYDGRDPDALRLLYQMQSDTFTVGFGYAVSGGHAYAVNSFFGTLDVFDVVRPVPRAWPVGPHCSPATRSAWSRRTSSCTPPARPS